MRSADLTCQALVEIVTEYLDGGLSGSERERFEDHVAACSGCAGYLDQIRTTIAIAGRITADDLDDEAMIGLLAAFRDWNRS